MWPEDVPRRTIMMENGSNTTAAAPMKSARLRDSSRLKSLIRSTALTQGLFIRSEEQGVASVRLCGVFSGAHQRLNACVVCNVADYRGTSLGAANEVTADPRSQGSAGGRGHGSVPICFGDGPKALSAA